MADALPLLTQRVDARLRHLVRETLKLRPGPALPATILRSRHARIIGKSVKFRAYFSLLMGGGGGELTATHLRRPTAKRTRCHSRRAYA